MQSPFDRAGSLLLGRCLPESAFPGLLLAVILRSLGILAVGTDKFAAFTVVLVLTVLSGSVILALLVLICPCTFLCGLFLGSLFRGCLFFRSAFCGFLRCLFGLRLFLGGTL